MQRNLELEATIVEKYAAVEAYLDERGRRIWAATESRAIGYGGDALFRMRRACRARPFARGAGSWNRVAPRMDAFAVRARGPGIEQSQPGIKQALEKLVDP